MAQVSAMCAELAESFGDDPLAIAQAVMQQLGDDPEAAEKLRAVEQLLAQSHHVRRPQHIM